MRRALEEVMDHRCTGIGSEVFTIEMQQLFQEFFKDCAVHYIWIRPGLQE